MASMLKWLLNTSVKFREEKTLVPLNIKRNLSDEYANCSSIKRKAYLSDLMM
jgi:hypothetical protein